MFSGTFLPEKPYRKIFISKTHTPNHIRNPATTQKEDWFHYLSLEAPISEKSLLLYFQTLFICFKQIKWLMTKVLN